MRLISEMVTFSFVKKTMTTSRFARVSNQDEERFKQFSQCIFIILSLFLLSYFHLKKPGVTLKSVG